MSISRRKCSIQGLHCCVVAASLRLAETAAAGSVSLLDRFGTCEGDDFACSMQFAARAMIAASLDATRLALPGVARGGFGNWR